MYDLVFLVAAPLLLIAVILFIMGVQKTGKNARSGVNVMAWGYYIGLLGIFAGSMIYLFA